MFELEVSAGVAEALDHLGKGEHDVVLSDWHMPDGGGRRLYEEATKRWPELRSSFLFVTGGAIDAEDLAFLDGQRVLEKPLSRDKLLDAIAAIKPRRRGADPGKTAGT